VNDLADLERQLWAAADELRANSTLTAAQHRDPVLGLIFLCGVPKNSVHIPKNHGFAAG